MSIRVLLADDHMIMREGLKSLLQNAEDILVVAEAAGGEEAVAKALDTSPDVIVMDMNMPDLNGMEATRQIIASDPAARILILSMINDKECVIECLRAGIKGYLLKSCAAEELLTAIRALAAEEAYLCSKIADIVIKNLSETTRQTTMSLLQTLTEREQEVLRLLADGNSIKEIAFQSGVSIKTVTIQRQNIMNKLNLFSIAELTKFAIREKLTGV